MIQYLEILKKHICRGKFFGGVECDSNPIIDSSYPILLRQQQELKNPQKRKPLFRGSSLFSGLRSVRGFFQSKYPTIQIFDSAGNWYIIPLKKITHDVIFVRINGQQYPLVLDASKFKIFTDLDGKRYETVLYNLDDTHPIDPHELRLMNEYRILNKLPPLSETTITTILAVYDYAKTLPEPHKEIKIQDMMLSTSNSETWLYESQQVIDQIGTDTLTVPDYDLYQMLHRKLKPLLNPFPTLFEALRHNEYDTKPFSNPAQTPRKAWFMIFCFISLAITSIFIVNELHIQGTFNPLLESLGMTDTELIDPNREVEIEYLTELTNNLTDTEN